MTSQLSPPPEPDPVTVAADERSFAAWKKVEPVLGHYDFLLSLRSDLFAAVHSRRPSPVLSAVARLAVADTTNDLAVGLYVEAFSWELDVVARALLRRGAPSYHSAFGIAKEALQAVSTEAIFSREAQSGKTVTSRTWARVFMAAEHGRLRPLRAEALAVYARAREALSAFWCSLAGKSPLDRIAARLAPLLVVGPIVRGAGFPGEAFDAGCVARGLPLGWARRQAKAYLARLSAYDNEIDELSLVIEAVVEDLVAFGPAAEEL